MLWPHSATCHSFSTSCSLPSRACVGAALLGWSPFPVCLGNPITPRCSPGYHLQGTFPEPHQGTLPWLPPLCCHSCTLACSCPSLPPSSSLLEGQGGPASEQNSRASKLRKPTKPAQPSQVTLRADIRWEEPGAPRVAPLLPQLRDSQGSVSSDPGLWWSMDGKEETRPPVGLWESLALLHGVPPSPHCSEITSQRFSNCDTLCLLSFLCSFP